MKGRSALAITLILGITIGFSSCSNKTEEYKTDKLSDYLPLQPGKYITYRLDSLTYSNFGTIAQVRRYQVKHEVDAQITDNLGRPSYRVYTYIRDSAGTQLWTPNGTYMVTPLADQVELIEDNFRIIKLHLPVKEGFQWKGNVYLSFHPYAPTYNFINDGDIQDWDFTYEPVEASFGYRGNSYKDVLTVSQADDKTNAPVTNPNAIGYETFSEEKYAKGIGLVYRKYILWDYQLSPTQHYTGFGITMWMIDHN
jgi:hypothetical protein